MLNYVKIMLICVRGRLGAALPLPFPGCDRCVSGWVFRENNMYIFSGNATILRKSFNSGHFWVAQNDFGGRTLGRRQQDLGTLWLSGRLDD